MRRVAERAADQGVVDVARTIGSQERAMGERLAACFDVAVEPSLREKGADDIESELVSYLTDAQAIESQALQLLESGPAVAGFDQLADVFRQHLGETRRRRSPGARRRRRRRPAWRACRAGQRRTRVVSA